nr:venom polypeptide precursor [Doratifera vulnerans]
MSKLFMLCLAAVLFAQLSAVNAINYRPIYREEDK